VASVPARSKKASLISKCERTSRTCSTGVSSQAVAASCPGGVAAQMVRWGPRPGSTVCGVTSSASPSRPIER
jgi:hypothetical protein